MQYLVLLRSVDPYILRRAVICNLGVEHGQFGNLDEISEPFFLHDLVGHGKLVVDGFLGKYGRPGIEGADILTLQLLRAQVLEKQVQFRERVGDGRSREERRPQVAARALLYGTQREKHVERPLRPLGISEARHPVMPGRESQVLEFMR